MPVRGKVTVPFILRRQSVRIDRFIHGHPLLQLRIWGLGVGSSFIQGGQGFTILVLSLEDNQLELTDSYMAIRYCSYEYGGSVLAPASSRVAKVSQY